MRRSIPIILLKACFLGNVLLTTNLKASDLSRFEMSNEESSIFTNLRKSELAPTVEQMNLILRPGKISNSGSERDVKDYIHRGIFVGKKHYYAYGSKKLWNFDQLNDENIIDLFKVKYHEEYQVTEFQLRVFESNHPYSRTIFRFSIFSLPRSVKQKSESEQSFRELFYQQIVTNILGTNITDTDRIKLLTKRLSYSALEKQKNIIQNNSSNNKRRKMHRLSSLHDIKGKTIKKETVSNKKKKKSKKKIKTNLIISNLNDEVKERFTKTTEESRTNSEFSN